MSAQSSTAAPTTNTNTDANTATATSGRVAATVNTASVPMGHHVMVANIIKNEFASMAEAAHAIEAVDDILWNLPTSQRAARGNTPASLIFINYCIRRPSGECVCLFKRPITPGSARLTTDHPTLVCVAQWMSNGSIAEHREQMAALNKPPVCNFESAPKLKTTLTPFASLPVAEYPFVTPAFADGVSASHDATCVIMECLHIALQNGLQERTKAQVVKILNDAKANTRDPVSLAAINAKLNTTRKDVCLPRSMYTDKLGNVRLDTEFNTDNIKFGEKPNACFAARIRVRNLTDMTMPHAYPMLISDLQAVLSKRPLIVIKLEVSSTFTNMGHSVKVRCSCGPDSSTPGELNYIVRVPVVNTTMSPVDAFMQQYTLSVTGAASSGTIGTAGGATNTTELSDAANEAGEEW